MLIIGAGGFALQLFDDLVDSKNKDVVFWSETETKFNCLKDHFRILHTDQEAIDYFNLQSRSFITGIWDIEDRKRLTKKFSDLGGELTSFITPFNNLSAYTTVGCGSIVLFNTGSEPYVQIGENCIINKKISFGHGCSVESYCSIGPLVIIGSDAVIGENSYIGMGAIVQPRVRIGKNVIIAAGSVVTKNIADNAVVSGMPARVRFYRKI